MVSSTQGTQCKPGRRQTPNKKTVHTEQRSHAARWSVRFHAVAVFMHHADINRGAIPGLTPKKGLQIAGNTRRLKNPRYYCSMLGKGSCRVPNLSYLGSKLPDPRKISSSSSSPAPKSYVNGNSLKFTFAHNNIRFSRCLWTLCPQGDIFTAALRQTWQRTIAPMNNPKYSLKNFSPTTQHHSLPICEVS